MKLNSNNEWDRLRAVVVGTVDGYCPGVEIESGRSGELDAALEIARAAYPQWYMDEVAEDLEDMCGIFRTAGVTVLRPKWTEASQRFATPNWAAVGHDIYNVRDLNAVFGNTLVASASPTRFRLFESYALRDLLYANFFDEGFRWLSAPTPRLRGEYVHEIQRSPTPLETVEDALHQQKSRGLHEVFHYLDEDEIIFDAANIIRLGRDILFLVSSTANRKAVQWLQSALGSEYRVHVTHAYRSSHLDSTIAPLREGFVLLNGARVNEQNCPEVVNGWNKLFFTDVAPVPEVEVTFQRNVRARVYEQLRQMGVASSMNHVSSPWGGLNVLSLDPQTVLVHDQQHALMRALDAKGFTVVPVRMRHQYTMMGGLHCTTLDVIRDSQ